MKTTQQLAVLAMVILTSGLLLGQGKPNGGTDPSPDTAKNPFAFNLTVDGYIVPHDQSYVDPVFTADHEWLHLEARYNYENLRTGSVWIGYKFTAGKKLVLDVTPMIGGVFGRTTGIAPGCEASLVYKKVELTISNEYVFDTTHKSGSFYYAWPELTYSPLNWFHVGLVAEHTKAFHSNLDVQRGFLVGVSHKKWEFTTYVFNPGFTEPSVTLEVGVNF